MLKTDPNTTNRPLRVSLATPLGFRGQGGIDRLNDAIFDALQVQAGIRPRRLVTRGRWGLFVAQFVFASALISFSIAALLKTIDLLHIHLSDHGSSYRKTILGSLARLFSIPYVVHLHGVNFGKSWLPAGTGLAKRIDQLFLNSSSIIVLGEAWSTMVKTRLPCVEQKIVVLPNATRRFPSKPESHNDGSVQVSFLGQLGPRKGSQVLISALSQLRKRNDWNATLAGDGELSESQLQAKQLGLARRINFPGWLNADETERLLQRTDILVLPSFAENLPMVIIEGFAAGIAVLSTPVGAIPEVIQDGRNGLLVPAGDATALSKALERLIVDQPLRQRLGKAALADHAERYELGAYMAKLVDIWRIAAHSHLQKSTNKKA